MIEQLKTLKEQQADAIKKSNFKDLNTINKQIFEIRQAIKKEKEKEKEIEIDNKITNKINLMMEL